MDRVFFAYLIAGFAVALFAGIAVWRKEPRVLLKLVSWLTSGALLTLVLIGAMGVPLFLYRFQKATFDPSTISALSQIHHISGRTFLVTFVVLWPLILVPSIARSRTAVRKLTMSAIAVFSLFVVLLVSITGYALPAGMPGKLDASDAVYAIRFALVHVFAGPTLGVLALALLWWRHQRAVQRM